MNKENTELIRERVLGLIASEFESAAAFEREMGLADRTVNNWRRMRSSSFMQMLPELSELFKVNVGELLNIPLRKDTSELSDEELHLLHMYRKARSMPEKMRRALRETLEVTINLYITSASEIRATKKPKQTKK